MNKQGRILVIDREPQWQRFIVDTLRQDGYQVQAESDAQTTVREIRADNFDLIIVDAALLAWLDAPAIAHLRHRLLVVTAAPSVSEALWAFRRGALDYIGKVFDASALLISVAAALKNQPVPQRFLL